MLYPCTFIIGEDTNWRVLFINQFLLGSGLCFLGYPFVVVELHHILPWDGILISFLSPDFRPGQEARGSWPSPELAFRPDLQGSGIPKESQYCGLLHPLGHPTPGGSPEKSHSIWNYQSETAGSQHQEVRNSVTIECSSFRYKLTDCLVAGVPWDSLVTLSTGFQPAHRKSPLSPPI